MRNFGLSERDLDILQCWLNGWAEDGEMRLYGHISYNDVKDLVERLGLETPGEFALLLETGKPRGC